MIKSNNQNGYEQILTPEGLYVFFVWAFMTIVEVGFSLNSCLNDENLSLMTCCSAKGKTVSDTPVLEPPKMSSDG